MSVIVKTNKQKRIDRKFNYYFEKIKKELKGQKLFDHKLTNGVFIQCFSRLEYRTGRLWCLDILTKDFLFKNCVDPKELMVGHHVMVTKKIQLENMEQLDDETLDKLFCHEIFYYNNELPELRW